MVFTLAQAVVTSTVAAVVLWPGQLPLSGEPALVWLEGPVGEQLDRRLLKNCYAAVQPGDALQVVCLD